MPVFTDLCTQKSFINGVWYQGAFWALVLELPAVNYSWGQVLIPGAEMICSSPKLLFILQTTPELPCCIYIVGNVTLC